MQVDVFTSTPTLGNALAVVLEADGLDDETMRRFAAWTNLAETTFLLPPEHPDADYRVRILTPTREMPFAGHPTLGSGRGGQGGASRDTDFEVRMLAPSSSMVEDPITGSLNAALAHWLLGRGRLTGGVTVAQGGCIGRLGRVHVRPDPDVPGRVRIGGESHVLIEGSVEL